MSAYKPEDLHKEFETAFNAGNLNAVMALYEADATLVPQPGCQTTGHQANREALQQYMAMKGRIEMTTLEVVRAGNLALLRGEWRVSGTGPDGKPLLMAGKNIEVARRQQSGEWLFAIDHPFGAN